MNVVVKLEHINGDKKVVEYPTDLKRSPAIAHAFERLRNDHKLRNYRVTGVSTRRPKW